MKKIWFLLPLLAGCGLFQKKNQQYIVPALFPSQPNYLMRKSLVLDYIVKSGSSEFNYSVYPLSDSGYDFDFEYQGNKGTCRSSESTRMVGYRYSPRGLENTDALSSWLSKKTFSDLQLKGTAMFDLGEEGMVNFKFTGEAEFLIAMEDTSLTVRVAELTGVEKPYYLAVLIDPDYPLVVKSRLTEEMTLVSMQNEETAYGNFEPGKGCVLQYRMVEAGVNDYMINLHNIHWDDTVVSFDMSGTYSGSYDYEFQYKVIFKGNVLTHPDFMVPLFSAIKGEKVETSNWVFLRKNEISEMERLHKGYLQVPHFAVDPRDYRDDYSDSAEFNEDLKSYLESYRTEFVHDRIGRLKYTDFMYYDNDWNEERMMPALRMLAPQHDMEIMVLNRGPFPLLLFYDDGQMYEIILESAGMSKGEE